MARDLDFLNPDFRQAVDVLLDQCRKRGVVMTVYETLRHPMDQARLYRQSRSTFAIRKMADNLSEAGATYLAHCLISVGPQAGKLGVHKTRAIPGLSWHQWGEAVDCFWSVGGRAEWSVNKVDGAGQNGYRVYSSLANDLGLCGGGASWGWDFPHVQQRKATNPTRVYSILDVDKAMRERFG